MLTHIEKKYNVNYAYSRYTLPTLNSCLIDNIPTIVLRNKLEVNETLKYVIKSFIIFNKTVIMSMFAVLNVINIITQIDSFLRIDTV